MGLGAILMFAGEVIYRVILWLITAMVGNRLGSAVTGHFGLLMSVERVAETLGRAGLPMTNHRFVARCIAAGDNYGVRVTARLTAFLAVATSIPVFLALWFAAPWLAGTYYPHPELTTAFRICGAVVPLTALMLTMLAVPQAARNAVPFVTVSRIGAPLAFAAGAAVVVVLRGNAQGLMLAYAGSVALGAVIAGIHLLHWLPDAGGKRETDVRLRSLVLFSLTMTLKTVSTLILFTADMWILGRYVSSAELGVYFAASRTAQFISFPRQAVNPLLSPTASALHTRGDIEGLRKQYVAATRWTVGASLFIFGVICIIPRLAMRVIGKEFVGGESLLMILSWSWVAQAAFAGSQFVLIMTGGQKVATVTEWIGAILFVAGLPYICAHWGSTGAAWWVLISVVGVNCAREINLHQRLHIHPFDGRFLWASVASAALIWPLSYLSSRHPGNLPLAGVLLLIFAVAFSVICWYGWMPELAARLRRKLERSPAPPTSAP
jgi:O-antigen/teichoic acid export membrane protein